MDESAIRAFVAATYPGVDVQVASAENGAPEVAWGDTFFIHDPERNLEGSRRFPFATIVTKDYGDFDGRSNLNRPGVFRLNIGVSKETYQRLFPNSGAHDFTALDVVMPHPVYGVNHWVSVLNPSDQTFNELRPLLDEAYEIAVRRNRERTPR
ncbi:MAG TPA: DUF6194 family protein [Candidatus Dormibacteraeota bacterium]|nr:DUF6194 family protein [Candidatus Dormibacteraeota bacterium]